MNLVDVAILKYGNAESIVKLCQDNGITLSGDLAPGNALLIDGAVPYKTTGAISAPVNVTVKRALTVFENQNLVDVCLQEYGSIDALVGLAHDNSLGVDSLPLSGSVMTINPGSVIQKKLVSYLAKNGIVISQEIPQFTTFARLLETFGFRKMEDGRIRFLEHE
jgi:hypothetical protein